MLIRRRNRKQHPHIDSTAGASYPDVQPENISSNCDAGQQTVPAARNTYIPESNNAASTRHSSANPKPQASTMRSPSTSASTVQSGSTARTVSAPPDYQSSVFSGNSSQDYKTLAIEMLPKALTEQRAHGAMYIQNAFATPRGTVISGYFIGTAKVKDYGRLISYPASCNVLSEYQIRGIESGKTLLDAINAQTERTGCGFLILTHGNPDSLVGKYFVTYSN